MTEEVSSILQEAINALAEDEQMLNEWLEHGADYIHLHISDLDTKWEDIWD